jgi:ACS family hexuronate transporter-like MFS transporter
VDRGVIAYLKNTLESVIPGLNDAKYGVITACFTAAYAIGMLVAGGLTDKLGTRKAFAIAICMWSVAAMLPGAAFSVVTFGVAMFLLGLGEAATFPPASRRWPSGFPSGSARWLRESSTPAPISETSLCRSWSRHWWLW